MSEAERDTLLKISKKAKGDAKVSSYVGKPQQKKAGDENTPAQAKSPKKDKSLVTVNISPSVSRVYGCSWVTLAYAVEQR